MRDISIKPGAGAVMVSLDDATLRLVMPSAGQALALRELWQSGPVTLAMGIALDDGRAMLGFSGADEDVLVSTRVSLAPPEPAHRPGPAAARTHGGPAPSLERLRPTYVTLTSGVSDGT